MGLQESLLVPLEIKFCPFFQKQKSQILSDPKCFKAKMTSVRTVYPYKCIRAALEELCLKVTCKGKKEIRYSIPSYKS